MSARRPIPWALLLVAALVLAACGGGPEPPPGEDPLTDLATLDPLRDVFAADAGRPRLLLILAPT